MGSQNVKKVVTRVTAFFIERPIGVTAEEARVLTALKVCAAGGRRSKPLKSLKLAFQSFAKAKAEMASFEVQE